SFEGAKNAKGVKAIAIFADVYQSNRELIEQELARLREQTKRIQGLEFQMPLLVRDDELARQAQTDYGATVAAYRRKTGISVEQIVFVPASTKTLEEIQRYLLSKPYYSTISREILVVTSDDGAGLKAGRPDTRDGKVAILMQLDGSVTPPRGFVTVAANILIRGGSRPIIPGLIELAPYVFRYLPMIKPADLTRILREINAETLAVGASA
ncbi:MAG: hypothetical protein WCG06_04525, partial [Candidatus Omnitrophota bacterium]